MTKLRIYFDVETMEQIAEVSGFAEHAGLPFRVAEIRERATRVGGNNQRGAPSEIQAAKVSVGDAENASTSDSGQRVWKHITKILDDAGGQLERRKLVTRLARVTRLDKKKAGYQIAYAIRTGALVDDFKPASNGDAST